MMSKLRSDAEKVIRHVIHSVDPGTVVERCLSLDGDSLFVDSNRFDLSRHKSVCVLAGGKAACSMARAIEKIIGERITGGLVSTKYGHAQKLEILPVIEASHPVPDEMSVKCASQTLDIASRLSDDDLLLVLISGGASAIWCAPAESLTLEDKRVATSAMLSCGATIHEINTVRKHLSSFKGGRLAEAAHPATVISLVLSDVIGDDLTSIASGPTVPDPTTFEQAMRVFEEYSITSAIPKAVIDHLQDGIDGKNPETPKSANPDDIQNVVGSNALARKAASDFGHSLGYNVHQIDEPIQGEAKEAAADLCNLAKRIKSGKESIDLPALIVAGGEATVTLKGHGVGGRSQEMALAAAIELENTDRILFASFGTDGNDGPTDAAGALADSTTLKRAREHGMIAEHFLDNNDSHSFFRRINDLIITGPTGTNVMDIQLIFVE